MGGDVLFADPFVGISRRPVPVIAHDRARAAPRCVELPGETAVIDRQDKTLPETAPHLSYPLPGVEIYLRLLPLLQFDPVIAEVFADLRR